MKKNEFSHVYFILKISVRVVLMIEHILFPLSNALPADNLSKRRETIFFSSMKKLFNSTDGLLDAMLFN